MLGIDEDNPVWMNVIAMAFWLLLIAVIVWEEVCHRASVERLMLSVVMIAYSIYSVAFFYDQIRIGVSREGRIQVESGAKKPNTETLEAIREVRLMKKDPEAGKAYTDVDVMMEELLK